MIPADYNPYQPPEQTADPAIETSLQPLRRGVQRFRQESRALAEVAIFFASITALPTIFVARSTGRFHAISNIFVLPGIVVSIGLLVLGVQVARMKIWAVRILRILAYAMLVPVTGSLLFFGTEAAVVAVPAAAVFGLIAAQCHRVVGYARMITSASIPLNIKPHQINLLYLTPKQTPPGHE